MTDSYYRNKNRRETCLFTFDIFLIFDSSRRISIATILNFDATIIAILRRSLITRIQRNSLANFKELPLSFVPFFFRLRC